jgi:hypothetical protein
MAYETERKMTTWSKSSTETRDLWRLRISLTQCLIKKLDRCLYFLLCVINLQVRSTIILPLSYFLLFWITLVTHAWLFLLVPLYVLCTVLYCSRFLLRLKVWVNNQGNTQSQAVWLYSRNNSGINNVRRSALTKLFIFPHTIWSVPSPSPSVFMRLIQKSSPWSWKQTRFWTESWSSGKVIEKCRIREHNAHSLLHTEPGLVAS